MNWWNSFETLSKLQTALAILVIVLGTITLTFRVRADHLKKVADARKAAERGQLDKELKEKTAQALTATTALEARQAPWTLSERQTSQLKALLTQAPRGRIEVAYILSDAERAGRFAKLLGNIFRQCGYEVYSEIGMFTNTSDPPPVGLLVIFRTEQDRERALTYCKIFQDVGIHAECIKRNDADQQLDSWINSAVSIYVRNKPI